MQRVFRILLLVLLFSVVACDRKTLGYAGTSKKGPENAPEYTVQPKLNLPTKTM